MHVKARPLSELPNTSCDYPSHAMVVDVEVLPGMEQSDASFNTRASEVRRHIKSIIGVTCFVVVKPSGGIPRSEGKAVRVVDDR